MSTANVAPRAGISGAAMPGIWSRRERDDNPDQPSAEDHNRDGQARPREHEDAGGLGREPTHRGSVSGPLFRSAAAGHSPGIRSASVGDFEAREVGSFGELRP